MALSDHLGFQGDPADFWLRLRIDPFTGALGGQIRTEVWQVTPFPEFGFSGLQLDCQVSPENYPSEQVEEVTWDEGTQTWLPAGTLVRLANADAHPPPGHYSLSTPGAADGAITGVGGYLSTDPAYENRYLRVRYRALSMLGHARNIVRLSVLTGPGFLANLSGHAGQMLLVNATGTTIDFGAVPTFVDPLTLVPIGGIVPFAGAAAKLPANYLACHGTAFLRTTYPELFGVIGTTYGAPDATRFRVPDYRGYFLRGVDNGAQRDPDVGGRSGGSGVGSIQDQSILAHQHPHLFPDSQAVVQGGAFPGAVIYVSGQGGALQYNTYHSGGNETRPKNVYAEFAIRAI